MSDDNKKSEFEVKWQREATELYNLVFKAVTSTLEKHSSKDSLHIFMSVMSTLQADIVPAFVKDKNAEGSTKLINCIAEGAIDVLKHKKTNKVLEAVNNDSIN